MAKCGAVQGKQGRALTTLYLVQFLSDFGFKLVVSKGNYVPIAILIKENDECPNVYASCCILFDCMFATYTFSLESELLGLGRPLASLDLEIRARKCKAYYVCTVLLE